MSKKIVRTLTVMGLMTLAIHTANAADPSKTYGFWAQIPNNLFPAGKFQAYPATSGASAVQITTAENNPDVWCADQGQGYRTPYAGDMNEKLLSVAPPLSSTGKTGNNTRKVSTSLYNEWGDVTLYVDSGWDKAVSGVWVAEPKSETERNVYVPKTGELIVSSASNQNFVACVTDI